MGPFPSSLGNLYILVGVDYVSKWVEAVPCKVVISTQIVYFDPCILQVLSTFCLLINLNNPIDTLRSRLCY